MDLSELRPAKGTKHAKKRVGRGEASGTGKTSGRGHKGQGSRSGGGVRPGFEGGQMPLTRRVPKRGFHNLFRTEYTPVNLDGLGDFEAGAEVSPETLREKGLLKRGLVKILGRGDIDRPLTVKAHGFSQSARRKIEAAGGSVEVLSHA
ncbi:MAG: 50S ribosomal protein L15 [Deltaproteobacteria bacterium]|nr:50S ribosomal protein L15 [Deltaproteobacteria bacterium]